MTARILDPDFRWTDSASTNVEETWKRFGFKPTTNAERRARIRRQLNAAPQEATVKASSEVDREAGIGTAKRVEPHLSRTCPGSQNGPAVAAPIAPRERAGWRSGQMPAPNVRALKRAAR